MVKSKIFRKSMKVIVNTEQKYMYIIFKEECFSAMWLVEVKSNRALEDEVCMQHYYIQLKLGKK